MLQELKGLLAWFEPHEALGALLGFRSPGADEDVSRWIAIAEEKRRAMLGRPAFVEGPPEIDVLPVELASAGSDRLSSKVGIGQKDEPGRYRVVVMDLGGVVSFQKTVTLDRPHPGIASADPDDLEAIFDICLPSESREETLNGTVDQDGKGLTISSTNPNLRLGMLQTVDHPPGSGTQLTGFQVAFGASYMHVVEYNGRYFLKDGYHRAYHLLARGITRVPVVLQAGRTFADVYRGATSFIAPEHLLGTHPPCLRDFHDASVSADLRQRAFRKVVRIRAEEFIMNL